MHDDPKHWRQLAQKTRAAADQHADPDAQRTLLEIAAAYEQLAALAEKRLAAGKSK